MTNTDITGPVTTRSYVETSHDHVDMIDATGVRIAHRYRHIVTGTHNVRDLAANGAFGAAIYSGPDDVAANRAWVALYRKYN